jgi:hypothetical protein
MPARTPAVQVALALCAALLLGASAPSQIILREQAWTAPEVDQARAMIVAPGECVVAPTTETEIGRALFRSPNLLGGAAARAGLSCNACHSNGRVNANFLMPELTNRAGAADVTSEWSSHVRGDGIMNPVDIPDLVDVGSREGLGHARDPSLEHFVRGVIVEEFQGEALTDQALAGVVAYLRVSVIGACTGESAITLSSAADDVRRAIAAAENADAPTARLLLLAAQDGVGRIVERLPARGFSRDRGRFERLSRDLGALRREDVHAQLAEAAPGWRARFDTAVRRVAPREQRTYFNEAALRSALER